MPASKASIRDMLQRTYAASHEPTLGGISMLKRSLTALFVPTFFQAEDGIRDRNVTGVQTCALPILLLRQRAEARLSAQKLTRLLSPRDPRYFRVASLLAAHQDYVAAIPLMENVQREFPQS